MGVVTTCDSNESAPTYDGRTGGSVSKPLLAAQAMADAPTNGEADYKSEAKFKRFSAAVERALRSFELSTEWPDLISSLARLNKVPLYCTRPSP